MSLAKVKAQGVAPRDEPSNGVALDCPRDGCADASSERYRLVPTTVSKAIIKSHRAQTARHSRIRENCPASFSSFPSLALSSTCFTRTFLLFLLSSPYSFVDFLLFSLATRNDVFWQGVSRERATVHTSQATIFYVRFPSLPLPAAPFRSFLLLLFHFFPPLPSPPPPLVPALLRLVGYCRRCTRFFFFFFCSFSVTVTPASRYASSLNRPNERSGLFPSTTMSFLALWMLSERRKDAANAG